MYPLNDKDLDRLSRDAAEHYDVESSTSGWERLENKLDKELPVKEKGRRRFLFWLFFMALLTGGSLVYMLGRSPATNNLASGKEEAGVVGKVSASEVRDADKKDAEKKAKENTINSGQEKNDLAKSSTPARSTTDAAKDQPANSSVVKTDEATKVADKNKETTTGDKSVVRDQPRRLTTQQRRDNKVTVSNSNNRLRKPVKNNTRNLPAADNQTLAKNHKQTTDQAAIELMKTTMPVIDAQKLYEAGEIKKDIPAPAPEVAKKPEVKQNATRPGKWEFGLLTGPDFNNVKFKHNYKTGLNLGATIGYRISDRWQVNTGLIYTKKWYKVDGEDFTAPKHTWLSYQDIQMVTGSCNMFEIPINVRYDFSYNAKNRFFASTGLSSYIMDKQDYVCDYINNMGQPVTYPWKEDSNYNYAMSNVNFSIGYERAIGKNFSIQAEPYFKLPLKGLGYGSIKMNSYGMFVTFKYKPSVRIKK